MTGRIFMVLLVAMALAPDENHVKDVNAFRAKHEADYRREYVPLAGLFFLKPGANTAGSAPSNDIRLPSRAAAAIGRFVYQNQQVRFEPAAGSGVTVKGQQVTAPIVLTSDGKGAPDELAIGEIALWVHESGERRGIRMRDPKSEAATSFAGFQWFPIDDTYRVVATFIKDPAPHQLKIPNLSGDFDLETTEGVVEFTLMGTKVRMRPMTTRPGRLYFTFKDASSGHETYAAARFLYSDLKPDGTTVLDFNQAYNPPCAFNPYTTCPLPLPENRLTMKILAGERAYAAAHK